MLTLEDIAEAALDELFLRSYTLNGESRTELDPIARLEPTKVIGPDGRAPFAFVLTPSAPRGVIVDLDQLYDVSFALDRGPLHWNVDEFQHFYLAHVMHLFAGVIDKRRSEVRNDLVVNANGMYYNNPIVFASAPLHEWEHSAVATRAGVSVRAALQYDITRCRSVVTVDMLFGLRLLTAVSA